MKNLKILMTGGGTAGHVTPNLALIPSLKKLGYEIEYMGTEDGIERKIIEAENIKYHIISSGKLRRYFDLKNFTDPFKVIKGVFQASKTIRKEKPNIVFSKGGFVSVPVVMGAKFNGVPVIIHESDLTPGLANKLSAPYATKICITFPEAKEHFNSKKVVLTGSPIREELFKGNRESGLSLLNFKENKPILLVMGGSLGSKVLNDIIRDNIKLYTEKYNILHICGKGNLDNRLNENENYRQFEYVDSKLNDFYAASDLILSRAGANAIFEFLALRKPNLLVPLSKESSRGDQILNARSFEKSGFSMVLQEKELNANSLLLNLTNLYKYRVKYIDKMKNTELNNSVQNILDLIIKNTK